MTVDTDVAAPAFLDVQGGSQGFYTRMSISMLFERYILAGERIM